MVYYLLYIGVASKTFTSEDFETLIAQARTKNHRLNITGKLLHCEGTFIQLLEGAEDNVNNLYRSIRKDKRLMAVKTITMGSASERHFKDWSMAFRDVRLEEINELENCTHPDVSTYISSASSVKLLKLLAKSI